MQHLWKIVGAVLVGMLLQGLTSPTHAQDKKKKKVEAIEVHGEPKGFHAGESKRYALWFGKNKWHLRTTTAKKMHHFTGEIHAEGGTFTKIHSHHLEKEATLQDHWKVSADKKKIHFDFRTDKGIDGIDFQVGDKTKALRFNLRIDGKHVAKEIFIGHGNHHPHNDPFTLAAHPPKKKGCGDEDDDQ